MQGAFIGIEPQIMKILFMICNRTFPIKYYSLIKLNLRKSQQTSRYHQKLL